MIKLHPQILKKNGQGEFVILSFKEFEAIQEMLEDADDLLALRQVREEDDPSAPGYTLEEVRMRLGLTKPRRTRRKRAKRR
ncbi:MAG: type II toxin-antitoxin system Phd/YefM family antitoxin [Planctomycetota bacterium]|jgi:PHD/YefM family antitoxin component YafN of YafNO toxin-antitoxin module